MTGTFQSDTGGTSIPLLSGSINTQIGLCTKHHQWEYENEARLIAYEPDVKGFYNSISLDEGSHIEKVCFGYRCPSKHIETIKNILSNRGQIKHYQMRSNPEDIYNLSSVGNMISFSYQK